MKSAIMLFPLAARLVGMLHAEAEPKPVFSRGAVLQRGKKIPVWGNAGDGENVTAAWE